MRLGSWAYCFAFCTLPIKLDCTVSAPFRRRVPPPTMVDSEARQGLEIPRGTNRCARASPFSADGDRRWGSRRHPGDHCLEDFRHPRGQYNRRLETESKGKSSMKQVVSTDKAPKPVGPYSQAIRSGNFIFV